MNKRPVWTPEEDGIVSSAHEHGLSVDQTVKLLQKQGFKRGVQAIYSRRSRLGLANGRDRSSAEPSATQAPVVAVNPWNLHDLANAYQAHEDRITALSEQLDEERVSLQFVAEAITRLVNTQEAT